MKRGATEAETCRLNGWSVGTRIVGDEGFGPTVIEITAIGEQLILAKRVDGRGVGEETWTLQCREWELAEPVCRCFRCDLSRAETPDRTAGPSDAPDALAAPKNGGNGGVRL